jgi:hypothetical protein
MMGWPRFELVVVPIPIDVPVQDLSSEVVDQLANRGVPLDFFHGRYMAASTLRLARSTRSQSLVCFGRTGLAGSICIEPRTGEVVELQSDDGDAKFVNSSLRQFTDIVQATIERFPFYDRDDAYAEVERVARELKAIVMRLDPPAISRDLFWSTFIDDVLIGDFSTQEILGGDVRGAGPGENGPESRGSPGE